MKIHTIRGAMFALASVLLTQTSSATMIGYWRFEGSGTNWYNSAGSPALTVQGTVAQEANASPVNFPNPIPETGASNNYVARFGAYASPGSLTTGTGSEMITVPTSFTAEAFFRWVNPGGLTGQNRYILSHWQSTGTMRAWGLAFDMVNNKIRFILSSDGTAATVNQLTGLSVTPGGNYYVALTFNGTTTTDDVTVYLMNLDDPNPTLQSETYSSGILTLHGAGSVAKPFSIASLMASDGSGGSQFFGQIDEVRYTGAVLAPDQLLIVPEPGTVGIWGLGGALLFVSRRRRATTSA